jgi:hypothetical protein
VVDGGDYYIIEQELIIRKGNSMGQLGEMCKQFAVLKREKVGVITHFMQIAEQLQEESSLRDKEPEISDDDGAGLGGEETASAN